MNDAQRRGDSQLSVDVSVIVPVRNDPDGIARCLASLLDQSYPRERYEVIAVDNDSTDDTAAAIRSHTVIYAHAARRSSYAARMTGARLARGAVLAFIDADCWAERHWLRAGYDASSRADGGPIVAGQVVVRTTDPPGVCELYDCMKAARQRAFVRRGFGATANLFVTRATFDRVGGFHETLVSGGDFEFGRRAIALGIAVSFCPTAIVYTRARASIEAILRRSARLGYGAGQVEGMPGWTPPAPPGVFQSNRDLLLEAGLGEPTLRQDVGLYVLRMLATLAGIAGKLEAAGRLSWRLRDQ